MNLNSNVIEIFNNNIDLFLKLFFEYNKPIRDIQKN